MVLDAREQAVVAFGRQLAADANQVSDELYGQLAQYFNHTQIVDLTVFGGLMIVNKLVNSALQVDLDESLNAYRIQPEHILA